MSYHTSTKAFLLVICIITVTFSACTTQAAPGFSYEPDKKYAAFVVISSSASAGILETAKQQSSAEGLAIGPIEYYSNQNQNFDPIVQKLTASKQVTLLWVLGDLMALPAVRKSAAKFGYSGGFRFMPVSGQELPGK